MIFLYIFLLIVFLLLLILILPVSLNLDVGENLVLKLYYAGIKVFDSGKKKKQEPAKSHKHDKADKKEEKKPKKENKIKEIFKKSKENRGFSGTVKLFSNFAKSVLEKLVFVIKKITVRNLVLNLTVSSDDAAQTAIEYGTVCTALYPLLSFVELNADVKYKQINISADFNKTAIDFNLSLDAKTRLIYAFIVLVKGFIEYKNLLKEVEEK